MTRTDWPAAARELSAELRNLRGGAGAEHGFGCEDTVFRILSKPGRGAGDIDSSSRESC